jgi:branched-subunit amino acid aminotransferase/4-amino-4-deoxychorismate lyase
MAQQLSQSTHRLVQRQVRAGEPGHDPVPRPQLEIRRRRLRHDPHLRRRAFRLKEHIDRFYRSLRYLRIDPGLSPRRWSLTEEVVARNEHLRAEVGDWWVGQRVSRGVDAVGDEGWDNTGPQVVIEMLPLPLAKRGKLYRDGAEAMTTTARRIAAVDALARAPRRTTTST